MPYVSLAHQIEIFFIPFFAINDELVAETIVLMANFDGANHKRLCQYEIKVYNQNCDTVAFLYFDMNVSIQQKFLVPKRNKNVAGDLIMLLNYLQYCCHVTLSDKLFFSDLGLQTELILNKL